MTLGQKGLVLAALQLLVVGSLGAKLLADRATLPRVWVRTAPVDPNLPIRGRYVRIRIEVEGSRDLLGHRVSLRAQDGRLVAAPATGSTFGPWLTLQPGRTSRPGVLELNQPLAFFIPEHAVDPSRRAPGEELWVEVSVPAHGAPRPIRLGVKKDGTLTPLSLN